MCRWIAYQGDTIALGHYVSEPSHSLVAQSLNALESTSGINGDGFGLGWYGEHPEPGLYREIRPAWSDENLRYLCRHLKSHLFFAHVRAATGTPVTRPNCHPFACGSWMFMHNGYVGNWAKYRRTIESWIPDELYDSRVGTTDSEALFLAILGSGLMPERSVDPITAATAVLRRLTELFDGGAGDSFRFTAALTDGKQLFAFRHAFRDTANSLYLRASADSLLLVSEPLDAADDGWQAVPAGHAVAHDGEGSKPRLIRLQLETSAPLASLPA